MLPLLFVSQMPANSVISYGEPNAWGNCSTEARLGILRYKLLELLEVYSYIAKLFRWYRGGLGEPKLLPPIVKLLA